MVVLSLLVRFVLLNLQLSVQCFVYQRVCCLYQCSSCYSIFQLSVQCFVYQRLCCLYQCGSCYSIFSCLYSVLCINVCVVFTKCSRVTQYLAFCVVFCVSTFVLSFTSAVRVTQSLAVCVVFCVSTCVLSLLVQFVLLNIQLSVQCFVYQRLCCLYWCGSCYSIFSCLYSVYMYHVVLSFTSAVRVTQSLAVCVFFCVSTFVFTLLVQFVLLNIQLSVQCFVYQRFVLSFTSAVRVTQSFAVCVFFCVSTFVISLLVQFV